MRIVSRTTLVIGIAAVAVAAGSSFAAPDAALYVGTKSCGMCHKKAAKGNQLAKWKSSPHANAFKVLASAEAKAVAAKLGIADAQKSGKCLKCHATAYNFGDKAVVAKITVEEGVTCESCHGPGKNYKKSSIMKDHKAALAGGLVYPAKKYCANCHNDKAPSWDPERYTTKDGKKTGFDADQAYDMIEHPNPLNKKK